MPVHLTNDAINGSKPQPGSFRLCCKERFEDTGHCFTAHPGSGVTNREHHVTAGNEIVVPAALVNLTVDGFNDQSASFQHRVTGVYNQVHYYLFDLSGVCPYSPERCVQPDYNLDVLTDQTAEHSSIPATRSFKSNTLG